MAIRAGPLGTRSPGWPLAPPEVPVVVGYVSLGAGVLIGRSLQRLGSQTWRAIPSLPSRLLRYVGGLAILDRQRAG